MLKHSESSQRAPELCYCLLKPNDISKNSMKRAENKVSQQRSPFHHAPTLHQHATVIAEPALGCSMPRNHLSTLVVILMILSDFGGW
jgi:hypothetical protein